jgi:RNA polymerase primary sigma factor
MPELNLVEQQEYERVYDVGEIQRFYRNINARTAEPYLLDPLSAEAEHLDDEVIALLAMYALSRKATGLKETLDQLDSSLRSGVASSAKQHAVSEATIRTKTSKTVDKIATELDRTVGGIAQQPRINTRPTIRAPRRPRSAATAEPRTTRPDNRYVGEDHIKMYLSEIAQVPLLNAEQEVELSKRIEAGLVASAILSGRTATDVSDAFSVPEASKEELEWLVTDGSAAFEHFVSANTRLAVNIAGKYVRATTTSMDLGDRIQVANEALMHAVEKFDYKKGYKFSTYATWWLRQGIQRGLAQEANTIRIPVHMHEIVSRVNRFKSKWLSETGEYPSVETIAEELELTVDKVKDAVDANNKQPASLHQPIGRDGSSELQDIIDDHTTVAIDEAVSEASFVASIREALEHSSLTQREIMVVELRYGIGVDKPMTLDEIGKIFGVTRERIRQIASKSLAELRNSTAMRQLNATMIERD